MTTTIPNIRARRAEAGARYAAALEELRAALVELAAVEGLVGADRDEARSFTFATAVPDALPELRHREFAPHPPQRMRAAVEARRIAIRQEIAK